MFGWFELFEAVNQIIAKRFQDAGFTGSTLDAGSIGGALPPSIVGAIDHGGLTGLGDDDHALYAKKASNLSDLANTTTARSNLGAMAATTTLNAIPAPVADVSLNSHKITNLTDPASAQDAATKAYVDGLVVGLNWKASVRVASTANVTIASGLENGDAIDGITLATGDRVLLKDQSAGAENGIYVVVASGAASRATDADAATEVLQMAVFVQAGTVNADTGWVCTTNAPITLGSTALSFAQFSSTGGSLTDHNHTTAGGDGGDLDGARVGDFMEFAEASAPSTPASGLVRLYAKSDGSFYQKDDAGTETGLGGGSGIPATLPDAKGDIITATADNTAARLAAGTDYQTIQYLAAQSTGLIPATPFGWLISGQTVVGSVAASITFSSIPQTFTHLVLLVVGRSDNASTATTLNARFNADSGSNYDRQSMNASNATTAASAAVAETSGALGALTAASASSNRPAINLVTIFDYTGSAFHKAWSATRYDMRGTTTADGNVALHGGLWRSTSAITAIVLTPAAGNFIIGSKAYLYGVM